jgi:CBS domain-containing protein
MPQTAKGELSGTVRDWMSRTPLRAPPDTSVGRVAGLMRAQGIRHVLVMEGRQLVGIVSDRDVRGLPAEGEPSVSPTSPVAALMREAPLTVDPETPLTVAVRLMLEHKIGALPVLQDGDPVGILTRSDALEALLVLIEGINRAPGTARG